MSIRIIKIETYGMKSISKPMFFHFQNDSINYTKAENIPSIKAIYGMNGSGKSSFITSVDVYKSISSSYSYLLENSSVRRLNNLINKETDMFVFKVWFLYTSEKKVYCHTLVIDNITSKPFIKNERLARITGRTVNGQEIVLFETRDNNLTSFHDNADNERISEIIKKAFEKKNEYCSAISLLYDVNFQKSITAVLSEEGIKKKGKPEFQDNSVLAALLYTGLFIQSLNIFLPESDIHNEYDISQMKLFLDHFGENLGDNMVVHGESLINKNQFEAYRAQVDKMTKFIKLFKPKLRKIDIDRRVDGENYFCRLILNYGNYSVDYEYESTGLKHLMSLFSCLEQASLGSIAFIDEMDANLNEVYLSKLCEFFVAHAKGQLCFTTHNTAPMRILQSKRFGIDFINSKSESYQWIRNGNYSPLKLYSEGMIPGLPFNLEEFDFINVFFPEET